MLRKSSPSVVIKSPPSVKDLDKILRVFTSQIIPKIRGLEKVILYGSYARQKPHYRSDVDLLIIVSEKIHGVFERIYTRLVELSNRFEWSPLIMEKQRFHKLIRTSKLWKKAVVEEGVEIFPFYEYLR